MKETGPRAALDLNHPQNGIKQRCTLVVMLEVEVVNKEGNGVFQTIEVFLRVIIVKLYTNQEKNPLGPI